MSREPPVSRPRSFIESSTLAGFQDSINCLQFSEDGRWLAAGSDDGTLVVFDYQTDDSPEIVIGATAPVTALAWYPAWKYSIYVGYSDGDIFLYHLGEEPSKITLPVGSRIGNMGSDPVEALDCDPANNAFAAAIGSKVLLCNHIDRKSLGVRLLPQPPNQHHSQDGAVGSQVSPCAVHYTDQGRALIVSYVYHGIVCWDTASSQTRWRLDLAHPIARTAISPDSNVVIGFNLKDAFESYRLDQLSLERVYSVPAEDQGVLLPSAFIYGGDQLVLGLNHGEVRIVTSCDGSVVQRIFHPEGGMIQAIAYTMIDQTRHVIASGSSEQGANTTVKIWVYSGAAEHSIECPRNVLAELPTASASRYGVNVEMEGSVEINGDNPLSESPASRLVDRAGTLAVHTASDDPGSNGEHLEATTGLSETPMGIQTITKPDKPVSKMFWTISLSSICTCVLLVIVCCLNMDIDPAFERMCNLSELVMTRGLSTADRMSDLLRMLYNERLGYANDDKAM